MIKLEEIAHEAAYQHCRCTNCNGINHDTGSNCDKSRMYVCNLYWAGYHTAIDALECLCKKLGFPIEDVEYNGTLGLKKHMHFVQTLQEYATSDEFGQVQINKISN